MKYDLKKRIFLVQKFYELKHICLIQRAYRTKYKSENAPQANTIKNIVSNFEKTGSVAAINPNRNKRSKKREEAKNQLETMVADFPNLSIRKAASAVGVSPKLVYTILHDDLHLKPYKFHEWHKLEYNDYQKRVDFAEWFLSLPPKSKFYLVCSDEAYFYLTLPVNKQNNRQWAISQPSEGVEIPLQDEKILVWVAISATKVYGVYYFESSVKKDNYLEMLQTFFWPKHLRTAEYQKYYFQQDGASAHTATMFKHGYMANFRLDSSIKQDGHQGHQTSTHATIFYGAI